MNKNMIKSLAPIAAMVALFSTAEAQVYSETFESVTSAGGVGLYSFGYDKDGAANTYKQLNFGVWVSQSANSIISDVDSDSDLELRPNADGANNAKMWGTILDPTIFNGTGSGTYTFNVDLIGADAGASRIYLWSATGYDGSGANDLVLDVAEGGFGTYVPLQGTGSTSTSAIFMHEIADETVGGVFSIDFEYTAGDTLGIVFGSYNTAFAFDNLTITAVPEPATMALLAGVAALGLAFYRRRKG